MTSTQQPKRRRRPVQATQAIQQTQPVRLNARASRPAVSATTAGYLALDGSQAARVIDGNEDSEGEFLEPLGFSQPRFDASIPVDESEDDEDDEDDEDNEGTLFIHLFWSYHNVLQISQLILIPMNAPPSLVLRPLARLVRTTLMLCPESDKFSSHGSIQAERSTTSAPRARPLPCQSVLQQPVPAIRSQPPGPCCQLPHRRISAAPREEKEGRGHSRR
jgi:hypothetical protein